MKAELIYQRIGERLRHLRQTQGITQEELAKELKMSRGSVANIETGNQRFLFHDIAKIAGAVRCSPKNFMEGLW